MANHGYVRTKLPMTKTDLITIIDDLNKSHFNGNLTLEVDPDPKNSYIDSFWKGVYCRQFWLKNKKKFEIRHGGGSDHSWWVDGVITNAIAIKFDGMISDDGCEGKWKPNPEKYTTYRTYLNYRYKDGWEKKFPKEVVKDLLSWE